MKSEEMNEKIKEASKKQGFVIGLYDFYRIKLICYMETLIQIYGIVCRKCIINKLK